MSDFLEYYEQIGTTKKYIWDESYFLPIKLIMVMVMNCASVVVLAIHFTTLKVWMMLGKK